MTKSWAGQAQVVKQDVINKKGRNLRETWHNKWVQERPDVLTPSWIKWVHFNSCQPDYNWIPCPRLMSFCLKEPELSLYLGTRYYYTQLGKGINPISPCCLFTNWKMLFQRIVLQSEPEMSPKSLCMEGLDSRVILFGGDGMFQSGVN